ncbi:hypothetical protein CKM354_001222000 [Cercospora kikuchii]|uniref:Amino acid transporter n=1 Tax=Cercospora kikuchii TaxID=84275 RepID=A0A9P3FLL1_9PEZI|nr:uncharacterized protein CKM354_001222000 [Cercospora kikuchii]GIZ49185.1 hypothetical protein CKM354_001222000 [Cercospora kikuchii]
MATQQSTFAVGDEYGGSILSADEQLKALGHQPELRRTHTFWTLLALQTTILTTWSCNIVLYDYVFTLGGPMSMIYTTIIVGIGQTLLMASHAEYAGIWPHAGGQQFYTQRVAPARYMKFLSYVVGWCILISEVSTSSSSAVNSAEIMSAFIEYQYPDVAWKPWMTFLIYIVFLLGPVVTNLTPSILPHLSLWGGVFNMTGFVVWMAVFLAMAPRNSTEFVFTNFINESGWSSSEWVFFMAMYVPMYGLYGTDSTMHLVEEMKNPAKDGPRVMIWSMIISAVISFTSAIVMGFTTGNWQNEMQTTLPYFTWFVNTTGSVIGGGTFCSIVNMGLNYLIIVHANTAGSRLAWRMAKDSGFPFPRYFSHVSKKFGTPLRAMFAVLFLNVVAGCLILFSDLAFWALISGGSLTLQIAYAVPVICVLCRGRKILPPRPSFDLGKYGLLVNYISAAWACTTFLLFLFPQYVPVVGNIENMNWAPAIFGICVLACGLYWIASGRKKYMMTRGQNEVQ